MAIGDGKLLHTLRSWLDLILQFLLPVVDRRVCYFSLPDVSDNAYYVYRHLLRTRNGLDHLWLVQNLEVADRVRQEFEALTSVAGTNGNTLRIKVRNSIAGYLLHLTSRYLFYTVRIYTASEQYSGRRAAVSLWHGMPIKSITRSGRDAARWNRVFGHLHIASSPFFRDIVAYSFGVGPESVLVCRSPRCDALWTAEARALTRREIRSRLGISDNQKLIVWLPTFRAEVDQRNRSRSFLDDLPPWTLPQLNDCCRRHGVTVLLKLHPIDVLNDQPDVRVGEIRLLRSSEWARENIQLYDLLAASDALISDVSSVIIDYIPTGRPIGILGYDPATYSRDLTFPFQRLIESKRFHHMKDAAASESFIAAVADGSTPKIPAPDFSRVLHEDFDESGAEAVAARVGL